MYFSEIHGSNPFVLYLSRKIGESIVINNNVEMTITEIRGKSVKIGFNFPPDATVLRKEIHDKISEENQAASQGDAGMFDLMGEIDLSDLGSVLKDE